MLCSLASPILAQELPSGTTLYFTKISDSLNFDGRRQRLLKLLEFESSTDGECQECKGVFRRLKAIVGRSMAEEGKPQRDLSVEVLVLFESVAAKVRLPRDKRFVASMQFLMQRIRVLGETPGERDYYQSFALAINSAFRGLFDQVAEGDDLTKGSKNKFPSLDEER